MPDRRRDPRSAAPAALAVLLALLPAGSAAGQDPAEGPTVAGWARLSADGDRLTLRVSAISAPGWRSLHRIGATFAGPGGEERIAFDIEDLVLGVGGATVVVGTGAEATGRSLRVDAGDVVVTTGGARLEFTLRADVVGDLLPGTEVRIEVEDDLGRRARITRVVAAAAAPGSPWTAQVVGAVAAALLVGVLLGSALTARRHPPRVSVYAAVQRRLERERAAGGGRPARGAR